MQAYRTFYEDVTSVLEKNFGLTSDHQRYHNVTSPNVFARKYEEGKGSENNIVLRIAWSPKGRHSTLYAERYCFRNLFPFQIFAQKR